MATVLFIIVVILVVGPILDRVIRSIFKAAGRNRSRGNATWPGCCRSAKNALKKPREHYLCA